MLRESIEPQKKELLDCLPKQFTTSDAIQAGKEVGLSERSVMYSLVSLATNKIIKKVKRGELQLLQFALCFHIGFCKTAISANCTDCNNKTMKYERI